MRSLFGVSQDNLLLGLLTLTVLVGVVLGIAGASPGGSIVRLAGVAGLVAWKRRGWTSLPAARLPYRELAYAMAASLILRCLLLLTLDNAEPRYTLEFFPVLLVWAGALFATSPGTAAEQSG